ncbi:MAG: PKD domain-containing protein [Candidatus Riflebacteria bacterium]|nr:PKD domain-containing protein [Candidatus Riflebacteria bacterium]
MNQTLSLRVSRVLLVLCLASSGALRADPVRLGRGVNLVAVPGAPAGCSARSLADVLDASLVVRSVSEAGQVNRFEAYLPGLGSSNGFPVTSHAGYVVLLPRAVLFDPVAVTVTSANLAPLASAGDDQTGAIGISVTLSASSSRDPDGSPQALSYSWHWTGGTGPQIVLSNPGNVTVTFTPPAEGTYTFTVEVHDGEASAQDVTTVTVPAVDGFKNAANWEAFDAGNVGTGGTFPSKGYYGAVADGRYVNYVPYANNSPGDTLRHARVLRYDTQGLYTSGTSWDAYDAAATAPIPASAVNLGYDGAVWDGSRHVYFVPYGDQNGANAFALRYDTQNDASFASTANWAAYNVMNTSGLTQRGYYGGAYDGRYVYYAPFAAGSETTFHGQVLRHDTTLAFTQTASWTVFNAGVTGDLATVGYKGAVFDGRYVYFVPFRDTPST